MKLEVDRARCCGAGMCVLHAPTVFDQDPDDGRVVLLDPDPLIEHDTAVHDAVLACPSGAIELAPCDGPPSRAAGQRSPAGPVTLPARVQSAFGPAELGV